MEPQGAHPVTTGLMPVPPYHGPLTRPRLGDYCNHSHLTWGPSLGTKPKEPADKDGQATVSSPDHTCQQFLQQPDGPFT